MTTFIPANPSPRLVRRFVQHIHAAPERVFPLLCPEMEQRWLPGWTYRMIHSATGFAEAGAIFATGDAEQPTLWVVVTHEACQRVGFVRWQADGLIVHIEITLRARADGGSDVAIAYTYTVAGVGGEAALVRLSEDEWRKMMDFWQSSMNQWLADNPS